MRIEGPTVASDLFGSGKDGFKRGNPLTLDPATIVREPWLNAHQEYPVRVMEDAGVPVPTELAPDHEALLRALNARDFMRATANWKAPEYSFSDEANRAGFAVVPDPSGGPDRNQWVIVGDATQGVHIFDDSDLYGVSSFGAGTIWRDVKHAFGPGSDGRWIRVGNGGAIYSTDAAFATNANWSVRTSGTTEHLKAIAVHPTNDEVLVMGEGGRWCHSTDGETWTTGTVGTASIYHGVTWWDGEWVAVGTANGTDGVISRSSNHTDWSHDDMGEDNIPVDIVSDGTHPHAVTSNGIVFSLFDPAKTTWSINSLWSGVAFSGIDYDGAGYVISAEGGWVLTAPELARGVPGVWTPRKAGLTNPDFNFARAGGGRFIVGGAGGDIVRVSEARY